MHNRAYMHKHTYMHTCTNTRAWRPTCTGNVHKYMYKHTGMHIISYAPYHTPNGWTSKMPIAVL